METCFPTQSTASIRNGIDKYSTVHLLNSTSLNEYDRGILRSILADAITTQKILHRNKAVDFHTCPFCWTEVEDVEHLFWVCPRWSYIRMKFLTNQQLLQIPNLAISVRRCGIYPITLDHISCIIHHHEQLSCPKKNNWPSQPYPFAVQPQLTMIKILKARNSAEPMEKPDGFQWSDPRPAVAAQSQHQNHKPLNKDKSSSELGQRLHMQTHDDNGFLLSTSARPGGSRFQYVQAKTNSFKVVIPHNGKRHSFGPFSSEIDAAQKVKQFFLQVSDGTAALTRGRKRTEKNWH